MSNLSLACAGETIRGYDFKPMVGRKDSFVEGVVESVSREMGFLAFKITCTKDVFGGKECKGEKSRLGHSVFIPIEVSFMEYPGRIINLSK